MITTKVENPRYSNDYHSAIAYEAVYLNENGDEIRRAIVETNNDDPNFHKILNDFGDTALKDNKQRFLDERSQKKQEARLKKRQEKDHDLFEYKTDLFDYNFIHNTENKKLRRQIRKAQTIEEARFAATLILIGEVFGIEPQNPNINELLQRLSDTEGN